MTSDHSAEMRGNAVSACENRGALTERRLRLGLVTRGVPETTREAWLEAR